MQSLMPSRMVLHRCIAALLLLAGCRPSPPPSPAVAPPPISFLVPTVLHQGGDPISCGCRAPGGQFAFGTAKGRILITRGDELVVEDAGLDGATIPYGIAFIGDKLFHSTANESILYDPLTWKQLWSKKGSYDGDLIAFAGERAIFTNTSDSKVERLSLEDMSSDFQFDQAQSADGSEDSRQEIRALAASPDGKLLAVCLYTGVSVVDVATAKEKYYLRIPNPPSYMAVSFTSDSQLLYCASTTVRAWSMATGDLVAENSTLYEQPSELAISSDGALIAVGGVGAIRFPCYVSVFDSQLKFLYRFEAGTSKVSFLAFREDSHELITASHEGDVRLWDLNRSPPHAANR